MCDLWGNQWNFIINRNNNIRFSAFEHVFASVVSVIGGLARPAPLALAKVRRACVIN